MQINWGGVGARNWKGPGGEFTITNYGLVILLLALLDPPLGSSKAMLDHPSIQPSGAAGAAAGAAAADAAGAAAGAAAAGAAIVVTTVKTVAKKNGKIKIKNER